jgi:hypothetical protein
MALQLGAQFGISVNENNGTYAAGKVSESRVIFSIVSAYNEEKERVESEIAVVGGDAKKLRMTEVAKAAKVAYNTAKKYVDMYLEDDGYALARYVLRGNGRGSSSSRGNYGSRVFGVDSYDDCIRCMLGLYYQDRTASNIMYQEALSCIGVSASESTISRVLAKYNMGKGMPDLQPADKYSDANVIKFFDYTTVIRSFDPRDLHFLDEAHVDGKNVWRRKVRRCPLTGLLPSIIVPGSFRARYNIISSCCIRPQNGNHPVQFKISEENGNEVCFSEFIMEQAMAGVYAAGTVLVMDNAAIHTGKLAVQLREWLWNNYSVLVELLPPRFYELNPQELVFAFNAKKTKSYSLIGMPLDGSAVPLFCARAFSECSLSNVEGYFRKCGYI